MLIDHLQGYSNLRILSDAAYDEEARLKSLFNAEMTDPGDEDGDEDEDEDEEEDDDEDEENY